MKKNKKHLVTFDGFEMESENLNLLFYFPLGKNKLHAQFYNPKTELVVDEYVCKNTLDVIKAMVKISKIYLEEKNISLPS
jgi:hypothetical protein